MKILKIFLVLKIIFSHSEKGVSLCLINQIVVPVPVILHLKKP